MILNSINGVDEKQIKKFSSGEKKLDLFFKNFALKNDSLGYGKTFVLLDKNEIIGFFTLATAQIRFEEVPSLSDDLPKYPIPAIRIARFAIDKKYQRQGYGKELLKLAILKITEASYVVGVYVILVDAKDEAINFYTKYGFSKLKSGNNSLFLTINEVKTVMKKSQKN